MHLASDHVQLRPRKGRCRMRIFVPSEAEEGEWFGDTPVVLCSELAENAGEGITKSAEKIHLAVREAFGLPEVVWIEHHRPETTDRRTETCELVVFSAGSNPSWKPLDRASVEVLVGRCLTER